MAGDASGAVQSFRAISAALNGLTRRFLEST